MQREARYHCRDSACLRAPVRSSLWRYCSSTTKFCNSRSTSRHWQSGRKTSFRVYCGDRNLSGLVRLKLAIPYHCNWGQHLCLVGSAEPLGSWDIDQGVTMQWSDGDLWSMDVELPVEWGTELEYKYVVRGEDGSVSWKPGCNLCIRIPASDEESWFPGSIAVRDAWDDSFRSIEVGAREADEQELVALSMERALRELDTVIGHAFGMQERYLDPSAPERLAADRAVAAAARHAIAVTKALKGPGGEVELLNGNQQAQSSLEEDGTA